MKAGEQTAHHGAAFRCRKSPSMKTAVNDFASEPFFDPDNARGYCVRFGTLLGIAAVIATIGLYRGTPAQS